MKKKRLEIDYNFDFELLGVISSAKGYKLAWDINHAVSIRLIKQSDLIIHFSNQIIGSFTYFSHESALNTIKLFRNKPAEPEAAKNLLVRRSL